MWAASEQERIGVVTDEKKSRGQEIKRRRINAGLKSLHRFAAATERLDMKVSREAITAAEKGAASPETYDRLEAFLDRWEEETGNDEDEAGPSPRQITFRVHGNFGVDVVVQGPVDDADELERVVERLIRGMASGEDATGK